MSKNLGYKKDFVQTDLIKNGSVNNGIILKPTTLNVTSEDAKLSTDETTGSDNKNVSNTRSLLGFVLGVLASVSIASGTSCAQALQGAMPDFELAAMRGFVPFVLATSYFLMIRELPSMNKQSIVWVILFAVLNTAFNITIYLSVNYIPVGTASCIRFGLSIVVVTVLARIVVKEIITIVKIFSVLISISGVILAIQPWYDRSTIEPASSSYYENHNAWLQALQQWAHSYFFVSDSSTVIYNNLSYTPTIYPSGAPDGDSDLEDELLGYMFAASAAVFITVATIIMKARLMSCKLLMINFYTALVGTTAPLCISLATEELIFPTDWENILFVLGQSIGSGVGVILFVQAISMTTPILITLAMSLQVVFLLVPQYTVLSNIQPPIGNWVEILGAVLVLVSALLPSTWESIKIKCTSQKSKDKVDTDTILYSTHF